MSRALKSRVRAFEAALDRRHPAQPEPNPLEDFGPRYPGTIAALTDLAFRWMRRPGTPLEALVARDPVAAGAVRRLAAEVRREDAARGAEEPPRDAPGVRAADVAASRARSRAVADEFVRAAGIVR